MSRRTDPGGGTGLGPEPHQLLVVFDTVGYRHLTPAALTARLLRVVPSDWDQSVA